MNVYRVLKHDTKRRVDNFSARYRQGLDPATVLHDLQWTKFHCDRFIFKDFQRSSVNYLSINVLHSQGIVQYWCM